MTREETLPTTGLSLRLLFTIVAIVIAPIFLQGLITLYFKLTTSLQCWHDVLQNKPQCASICPNGSFALPGMTTCHQWLDCSDGVKITSVIVKSVVKKIYLGEWQGHSIVVSQLSSLELIQDFEENLNVMTSLGPNPYTVQFLGYCNQSIYTQYYKLGNALNFHYHLESSLQMYKNISTKFQFCIYYASIINFLHTSPIGVRVMCDSNSLDKTLSQYLLTDDFKLVLNDMDAIPHSDSNNGVLCGPRQLHGTFVAPEQLWLNEETFSSEKMIPYDEKTDIWKLPDVCNWFLGNDTDSDILKFRLFRIHKSCKDEHPKKRPSARQILSVYFEIWKQLQMQ